MARIIGVVGEVEASDAAWVTREVSKAEAEERAASNSQRVWWAGAGVGRDVGGGIGGAEERDLL